MMMKRASNVLVISTCILLLLMGLALSSSGPLKEVKAQENSPETKIEITPSDIAVGQLGQNLPSPVVTVNITVSNVTNLNNWQIKLYFDQSLISFESPAAIYPDASINIFGAADHFFPPAFLGTDPGTNDRYLKVGAFLLPSNPLAPPVSVNGSGVLTQLKFRGVSTGTSFLNYSRPYGVDTYLLNASELESGTYRPIPATLVDAEVTVLGNGVSIVAEPEVIAIGGSANITGLIYPIQIGTSITLSYLKAPANSTLDYWKSVAASDWKQLATVQTASIKVNDTYSVSGYTYLWKPDQEGLYFIMAHAPTAQGGPFDSQVKTVWVNPSNIAAPPNPWLVYGPIAAVGAVIVGGFFFWDRRRRHSGRMILP